MRLVVGVIGHVDHGKTSLVRALTGTDTDRLAEEKRRGISIVLGFAHLTVPGGVIDLIDTPGHERFVRTMVAGATGIDAALLVVDSREGLMPQTREHLDIAALLGIRRVIIAITKADLPDADPAGVAASTAALLQKLGLTLAACVVTSTQSGMGLPALRDALAALLQPDSCAIAPGPDATPSSGDGFAYLCIDRAFTLAGQGTIVTGTLRRGRLAISDEAELLPARTPLRLRGLQVNGRRVTEAVPGQRVAANLRDIEPGQIPRGAALATRGALAPACRWLGIHLRATGIAPPLSTGTRLVFLAGTTEIGARLRLLGRETLESGDSTFAQLHLDQPLALPARERFILRRQSPPLTIAGGIVLDPGATRLRRAGPLSSYGRLLNAAPATILFSETEAAGARGLPIARAAQLAGLSPACAATLLASDARIVLCGSLAVLRLHLDALCAAIPGHVTAEGITPGHLAQCLPGHAPGLIAAATAALAAQSKLRIEGGLITVPDAARDKDRHDGAQRAAQALAATLQKAGLAPPDIAPAARRLADALVRAGEIVRTLDTVQRREIYFHRSAVEAAKRQLAPHLTKSPGLLVGEAGALLGISRKYSVPLLEYLDAIHFTRRVADRRVLASATGTGSGC